MSSHRIQPQGSRLPLQSFLREGRVVGPCWEKLKLKGPKGSETESWVSVSGLLLGDGGEHLGSPGLRLRRDRDETESPKTRLRVRPVKPLTGDTRKFPPKNRSFYEKIVRFFPFIMPFRFCLTRGGHQSESKNSQWSRSDCQSRVNKCWGILNFQFQVLL